jgi:hypothetical protein
VQIISTGENIMSIDSYPSDKKLDLKVNLTKETQIPNQSREMQWLLVILFVALLMYIVTFNNFIVGLWQDDATYIILAKSLISGQGYRMINQVGKPLGKHYPIGYPLLLAPFVGLFPNSFAPLKILSLVCMLASSILLYTYSRKRLGTEYALFTTALFAW